MPVNDFWKVLVLGTGQFSFLSGYLTEVPFKAGHLILKPKTLFGRKIVHGQSFLLI